VAERQPRDIVTGYQARLRLLEGATTLAEVVAVTLGPHGRTVALQRPAGLLTTKDGVTVAREVDPSGSVEALGAKMFREACLRVHKEAGDGTTSTAVVAASLLAQGQKLLLAGVDMNLFLQGLKQAAQVAIDSVRAIVSEVEDQGVLERVAMVSSNGDEEMATNVAEACMSAGEGGTVVVQDGQRVGINLVFKNGMEIPTRINSSFLRESLPDTVEGPHVAVINKALTSFKDVRDVIECMTQYPPHHLILFAPSISAEAQETIAVNMLGNSRIRGTSQVYALDAPGTKFKKVEFLKDIAALADARFVDPAAGYDHTHWDPAWFGSFRRVAIGRETTLLTAYPTAFDSTQARVQVLQHERARSDSDYDKDQLTQRIAKLVGGLVILEISGQTEAALKERRGRLEDALAAVRGALEGGVVPGAGTAYLEASQACLKTFQGMQGPQEYRMAFRVLARALECPLRQLADNAGKSPGDVLSRVLRAREDDEYGWVGWDATVDKIRDLGANPVIADPLPVVEEVIRSAVAVTSLMLTCETVVSRRSK